MTTTIQYLRSGAQCAPEIDDIATLMRLADGADPATQEALAYLLDSSDDSMIEGYRDDLLSHTDAANTDDATQALERSRYFQRLMIGDLSDDLATTLKVSDANLEDAIRGALTVAYSHLGGRVAEPHHGGKERVREVVAALEAALEPKPERKVKGIRALLTGRNGGSGLVLQAAQA